MRASKWIALVVLAGTGWASAQSASPRTIQREARIRELEQLSLQSRVRVNPSVPVSDRALIDYGGYVTANYLSLDDSLDDTHTLRQYDFVAYGRVLLDNSTEVFVRFRTGYRDFNPGDSFDGRGDEPIDGDLDRAYIRFNLAGYRAAYQGQRTDTNVIIKAGRDLAYWANGLVLAQVLDGVVVDIEHENLALQILGGVTPVRTVDYDPSRPNFDHNTRRGFYGAMLSADIQSHTPFIYGLVQRDYNEDDRLVTGAVTTDFEYNSYYLGIGSSGALTDRLRYAVEFAYEFGDTLSNSFAISQGGLVPIPQTKDNIRAYGLDARLDYIIPDEHQTRLSGEFILASGDTDRGSTNTTFNGNAPGTNDRAFNSFGLLNTGLAFGPAASNVFILRGGASTFPLAQYDCFRRLQVGLDVFAYWKLRGAAPIDETTLTDRFLGIEPDLYLNWQVASDITLALRYGVFFPNSEAFVSDEYRHFLYAGVTFAY